MGEALLFIMAICGGGRVLGLIRDNGLLQDSAKRLEIRNPVILQMVPSGEGRMQINLADLCLSQKDENFIYANPEVVEVLGTIENDECNPRNDFWIPYRDAMIKMSAAKAGIIAPTGQNMANVTNIANRQRKPR